MRRRPAADQFAIAGRFAAVSQWIRCLAFHLQFRRAVLFLVNIGVPVLVGLARNESGAALVGGITGLFLSLADTEGTLGRRLRMVTLVACGIAVGGVLGVWVKIFHPILWIVFSGGIYFWAAEPSRQGSTLRLAFWRNLARSRCGTADAHACGLCLFGRSRFIKHRLKSPRPSDQWTSPIC